MKDERPRPLQISEDRNIGFNKKYTTIAIYVVAVMLFAAVLVYLLLSPDRLDTLLSTLKSIVSPIIIGLIIAFLLYPVYRFFETHVYISSAERRHQKCRRRLFKAKLRYDFARRAHPTDSAALESASKALDDAKQALADATLTFDAEQQKKAAKRALHMAKKRRPSYLKQAPSDPKLRKTLSLLSAYLCFILVIAAFLWMLIPPCIESIGDFLLLCRDFITTLPGKLTSFELGRQIRDLLREFDLADDVKNWVLGMVSSMLSGLSSLFARLPNMISALISNLTDIVLGIFFSVYLLSARKMLFGQLKKLSKAILPRPAYVSGRHILHEINRKFGKYIQGKLLSSAILGVVSFILFGAVGIPYFQMITLIVTVTNLIPFFGPFIGAIPSGMIILIAKPDKLIIFIILVLIIQQIEGNILEPYILGDSLGLEPVWIMVAIVVMGEIFGILGMVLGVPFFAVFYTIISEWCDQRLKKKRMEASSQTPKSS